MAAQGPGQLTGVGGATGHQGAKGAQLVLGVGVQRQGALRGAGHAESQRGPGAARVAPPGQRIQRGACLVVEAQGRQQPAQARARRGQGLRTAGLLAHRDHGQDRLVLVGVGAGGKRGRDVG